MTGFTPGPWDADWWAVVLRDLHNFLPDGLRGPADEDDPWGTKPQFNYPGLTGHDEANANLIAKAPEMIEALWQYRDDLRHPPEGDSRERRLERVLKLIAEVEQS